MHSLTNHTNTFFRIVLMAISVYFSIGFFVWLINFGLLMISINGIDIEPLGDEILFISVGISLLLEFLAFLNETSAMNTKTGSVKSKSYFSTYNALRIINMVTFVAGGSMTGISLYDDFIVKNDKNFQQIEINKKEIKNLDSIISEIIESRNEAKKDRSSLNDKNSINYKAILEKSGNALYTAKINQIRAKYKAHIDRILKENSHKRNFDRLSSISWNNKKMNEETSKVKKPISTLGLIDAKNSYTKIIDLKNAQIEEKQNIIQSLNQANIKLASNGYSDFDWFIIFSIVLLSFIFGYIILYLNFHFTQNIALAKNSRLRKRYFISGQKVKGQDISDDEVSPDITSVPAPDTSSFSPGQNKNEDEEILKYIAFFYEKNNRVPNRNNLIDFFKLHPSAVSDFYRRHSDLFILKNGSSPIPTYKFFQEYGVLEVA